MIISVRWRRVHNTRSERLCLGCPLVIRSLETVVNNRCEQGLKLLEYELSPEGGDWEVRSRWDEDHWGGKQVDGDRILVSEVIV